jgi:hypothetical protein
MTLLEVSHHGMRERLRAPINQREFAEYDFFRGVGKRALESDILVVMLHGWLGSQTMNYVAEEVAFRGHDAVVPIHDHHLSLRNLLKPNARRSRDVHATIKHAVSMTGKKSVLLIDHSNGNQDALHVIEHAQENRAPYNVVGIGAVAGVGMNGKHVHVGDVVHEILEHGHLLKRHPREELQVIGRSLMNFASNPLLAVEEGLVAAYVDIRSRFEQVQTDHNTPVLDVFLDSDHIIRAPVDAGLILPGSHMTPVVTPEVVTHVVDLLIERA